MDGWMITGCHTNLLQIFTEVGVVQDELGVADLRQDGVSLERRRQQTERLLTLYITINKSDRHSYRATVREAKDREIKILLRAIKKRGCEDKGGERVPQSLQRLFMVLTC